MAIIHNEMNFWAVTILALGRAVHVHDAVLVHGHLVVKRHVVHAEAALAVALPLGIHLGHCLVIIPVLGLGIYLLDDLMKQVA